MSMTTSTETAPVILKPEERILQAFEVLRGAGLNGSATVTGMREEAIERFASLGIPTSKQEAWKYTNIARAFRHDYAFDPPAPHSIESGVVAPHLIPGLDAHLVVLVNGQFNEAQSRIGELPDGVVVTGFARATREHADLVSRHYGRYANRPDDAFVTLNTAFATDGVFIYVPADVDVQRPIHILNLVTVSRDHFLQPRYLYAIESGAHAVVVESGAGITAHRTFTNSVTEIYVGPNARFEHYQVQDLGDVATEVYNLQVYQERDSHFSTHTVTLSGALIRNNLSFLPDAENCETHLYGLFMGRGRMHVDNHTLVDHARPNCFSNELYKGILEDEATGVFNGKVYVRQDAQKTNAYQSNKSIVLSDRANMYSKPELEIYADDVKCSHGATTGQIDQEALFYLRARGLSERLARALLLQAFAKDVVDTIRIEPLREMLDARIVDRFHD